MGPKPLKNPWALKDGALVHISSIDAVDYAEVRRRPDFVHQHLCPRATCRDILYPKALSSEERRSHFAHLNLDCDMTHETAIHQVAKAIITERRYLWLPELPASPSAPYPIIHPRREMVGIQVTSESFVLGRWWADLEIVDHPGPFAIFQEEGEPVLLVEIVVTSPVSAAKIEAVQRAGMKMIAIKLDKEDAESQRLPEMILTTADRTWLAHPDWMDERLAEWDARDRRIEAERLAEEARVQDVIDRIRSGHPPEWQAKDEASIDRFVEDHMLEPYVGIEVPGSHWMAGDARWWQTTLLRKLHYERIQLKEGAEPPTIPKAEECLSSIAGFVIPFREKETDVRLLESVGVAPRDWSTPVKVVDAYLKELAKRKYGRRMQGRLAPARREYAIGYRHREIDQQLLLLLEGDGTSGTSEERIFEWKSEGSRIGTRREIILLGGRNYERLLEDTTHQAAAARRRRLAPHYYEDENEHAPANNQLVAAREAPPAPKRRALSAVRETGQTDFFGQLDAPRPTSSGDGRDGARQAYRDHLRSQVRPGSAWGEPNRAGTRSREPSSRQAAADHEFLQDEMQRLLVKAFAAAKKGQSPNRCRQMAHLYSHTYNPTLGCRPIDYCTTRQKMERCIAIATRH